MRANHVAMLGISIHALRKESDTADTLLKYVLKISIHALRKESDFKWINLPPYIDISIHALRKESDAVILPIILRFSYFNPRSP